MGRRDTTQVVSGQKVDSVLDGSILQLGQNVNSKRDYIYSLNFTGQKVGPRQTARQMKMCLHFTAKSYSTVTGCHLKCNLEGKENAQALWLPYDWPGQSDWT